MINHPRINKPAAFWRKYRHAIWALAYCGMIVYGSLFPFFDWRWPHRIPFLFLFQSWPHYITRTDVLTNILAYLPLGFLLSKATRGMVLIPVLYGTLLSLTMEALQTFVPGRVSSNIDLLTNSAGTLLGAVLAWWLAKHCWPWESLTIWRNKWFLPGRAVDRGLMLLCLWALSQLSLQLPSLVAGNMHAPFVPFWETLANLTDFKSGEAFVYFLEISGLGLFAATLLRPRSPKAVFLTLLFVAAVLFKLLAAALLIKLVLLPRLISLEALVGLGAGLAFLRFLQRFESQSINSLALGMFAGFALARLTYWALGTSSGLFLNRTGEAEMIFNITGFAYLVAEAWPFLAMLYLLIHYPSTKYARERW